MDANASFYMRSRLHSFCGLYSTHFKYLICLEMGIILKKTPKDSRKAKE
jgi:hypothetical protein